MFHTSTNSILIFSSHPTKVVAMFKQNMSQRRLEKIINAGKKRSNTKLVTYTNKKTHPCEHICEICQHDYNMWVRNSIMKGLAHSIRVIELYAPHLLK